MVRRLTADELRFTPPCFAERDLLSFVAARWGATGQLKRLSGERDQNLRLTTRGGSRYVLKVASHLEDRSLVDFQVKALQHIERMDPGLPVPRLLPSREGRVVEILDDAEGRPHAVRLLSYVDGVPIATLPAPSLRAIRRIGALQGRLARALQGFSHPAESHFMPWDSMNGLILTPELRAHHLPDPLRDPCEAVLERWEQVVFPVLSRQPTQVIHNDSHAGNVMCNPDDPEEITGVIDFGDLIRRPLVVDLSTSLSSLVERVPDVVSVTRTLLTGFREHLEVPGEQLELLLDAMLARAILTVQLLSFRIAHTEWSDALASEDLPNSIRGLETLMAVDREKFVHSVAEFADARA